jgi:hypothetical protein
MPKKSRRNRHKSSRGKYNDQHLRKVFPAWLPLLYGTACGVLIPWTIYLSYLLPPRYVSHHWDIAWTGFDIFEIILFAMTAVLAVKRSSWTALSAAMLGTVLLMDSWFDVLTANPGREQMQALMDALIIEVPIALISFALAHRIFNEARHHTIKP